MEAAAHGRQRSARAGEGGVVGQGLLVYLDQVDRGHPAAGERRVVVQHLAGHLVRERRLRADVAEVVHGAQRVRDRIPERFRPTARGFQRRGTIGGDLPITARACELLDLPVSALTAAEQSGLVTIAAGRVEFRSDLTRTSYHMHSNIART